MIPLIVTLAAVAGAWYLLIVRPETDYTAQRQAFAAQLKIGDSVLTVGGLYGRILELNGDTVTLEVASGVTSTVTTDAIAKIVPDIKLDTPAKPVMEQQDMQQPPEQQQPQSPQTPFSSSFVAPVFNLNHSPEQSPAQTPWRDVRRPDTPVQSDGRFHVGSSFLPPMPQIATRPPAEPNRQPMQASGGLMVAPPRQAPQMPVTTPMYDQPPAAQQLIYAPAPVAAPMAPHVAPPVEAPVSPVQPERVTKHSRAPQGMGSTLRLDDPSILDAMNRARNERYTLAEEYRKVTAPLVDTSIQTPAAGTAPAPAAHTPAVAPHETINAPIYAANGMPSGMPRPNISMTTEEIDPALQNAFQRPTPLANGANIPAPANSHRTAQAAVVNQ